jgi:hypothetical protein
MSLSQASKSWWCLSFKLIKPFRSIQNKPPGRSQPAGPLFRFAFLSPLSCWMDKTWTRLGQLDGQIMINLYKLDILGWTLLLVMENDGDCPPTSTSGPSQSQIRPSLLFHLLCLLHLRGKGAKVLQKVRLQCGSSCSIVGHGWVWPGTFPCIQLRGAFSCGIRLWKDSSQSEKSS